ncbi:MAG: hypothetical protein U0K93_01860 [Acutalibacteraceae bacterium]|nr:hypothetical protein [Acutalibacteraceae bacterium]
MTQNEFARQQQAAVERMREMNARAQINRDTSHKMPPVPSFVKVNESRTNTAAPSPEKHFENNSQAKASMDKNQGFYTKPQKSNIGTGLNIPFLDSILKDSDSTLIIGLLLILMSENSDKMLLFALIYILL